MLISSLTACPPHRRSRDGRQDLLREALELCLLVVADEADAEIGHAGVRVALQRADHRVRRAEPHQDRKSTRLNSSHGYISYAVFCLKKKKNTHITTSSHASSM